MDLPSDIWQIIGEDYTDGVDIVRLASTSRHIRSSLLSLVFRKISFRGSTQHSTQTLGHHFAYLLCMQERIEGLKRDFRLSSYIKHVVICDWVHLPVHLASAEVTCIQTSSSLAYKLISVWFETYEALFVLLGTLPNLRKVVFAESIKRNAWQTQPYHFFEDSFTEAEDGTLNIYSMLEFSVPETLQQVILPIPSSFNIPREEQITRLPTTTGYLLELLTSCNELVLTGAKFDGEMLYASHPSILSRLSTLTKLGVSNIPYWYTHMIEGLIEMCPDLIQLEVLGHDDVRFSVPLEKLRRLRSLTGSLAFLNRAMERGRVIEKLYLRDNDYFRISNPFSHNPALATYLHTLDISSITPATFMLLDSCAKVSPNLRNLTISLLEGFTCSLMESQPPAIFLSSLLQAVERFPKLEFLCVTNGRTLQLSSGYVDVPDWDPSRTLREVRVANKGEYLYSFTCGWQYQPFISPRKVSYDAATPGVLKLIEELSHVLSPQERRTFQDQLFGAVPEVLGENQVQIKLESDPQLLKRLSRISKYANKIWCSIQEKVKSKV